MIEVRNVDCRIGERAILKNLSCTFESGGMYGIIGPNGVGKSTLLHLLSGVGQPDSGEVLLDGKRLSSYPRKQLARRMAVLQQNGLPPVGFSVREVVEMARYPYQNWFGTEAEDSGEIVEAAISSLELNELQHRTMEQLSGGERQRVALAKLMAQQPDIILLDEPTTYLDIGYQIQLLDTVRSWQSQSGLTVIAVMHDLNLASLYFDKLLVLYEGEAEVFGTPHEVLTPSMIEKVYGAAVTLVTHPKSGVPQIMLQPNS